jgi:hypothetical protein
VGPVPKDVHPQASTVAEPRATLVSTSLQNLAAAPTNPHRPAPFERRWTPLVLGLGGVGLLLGFAAWRWL